jgi:hypothetical protein
MRAPFRHLSQKIVIFRSFVALRKAEVKFYFVQSIISPFLRKKSIKGS